MARRLKSELKVVAYKLNTPALRTIDPRHAYWTTGELPSDGWYGSMVRIQPPSSATDAQVEALQRALRALSVSGMKTLARASGQAVVGEVQRQQAMAAEYLTPRSVVKELVESSWYADKQSLAEIVEEFLSKAEANASAPQHKFVNVGHITGVRLENWLCYRGQQQIALGPTSYALLAEEQGNPERSNWLGKTSFLDALFFAITGEVPTETADEWIHESETFGGVDLEFSSSLFVSRYRARGKATRLEVVWNDQTLHGDAAQKFLNEAVISPEVFAQLFYIRQEEANRFVRMKPTAASEMVNKWLGIEWLQEATGMVMKQLDQTSAREKELQMQLEAPLEDVAQLETELVELREKERLFKKRLEERKKTEALIEEWNRKKFVAEKVEEYQENVEQHRRRAGKPASTKAAEDAMAASSVAMGAARKEWTAMSQQCSEQFDGNCPAFEHLKLTCPHKDHINSQGAANEKEAKRLKVVYDSKLKAYTSDKQALEQLQQENRERAQHAEKLKMSEVKLESALAAKKWLKENERPEVEAADIENAMETTRRIGEVQNAIKASNTASKQRDKLKAEHAAVHEQQLRLRAATAVLGRNGAQRVIADRALSTIEASGNEMLVRAGVPLNFKISWKEETSQPASECEKCGNAFPSSVKVKECTRCGEPRGRKMSEKLRVRLSDRSGGADAIAGVMFKLAAAHWYREYHGLGWPIFMVDEPFGALDKANVKALSNHISKLLEYFDAEQAFIIDHHAEVLDSMPARITLVGVGRRHTKVLSVASG